MAVAVVEVEVDDAAVLALPNPLAIAAEQARTLHRFQLQPSTMRHSGI